MKGHQTVAKPNYMYKNTLNNLHQFVSKEILAETIIYIILASMKIFLQEILTKSHENYYAY